MNPHPLLTLFAHPDAWQVFASGQAKAEITNITGPQGQPGIRLTYDFHGGGGFVGIRQVASFKLPESFQIGFQLRGEGPPNHFEFKVADPGGSNVWRNLNQDFELPAHWSDYRFNERSLPFAWGPAGGGAPSEIESIEFVIAAGPGGKGTLELAAPTFEDQTLRSPRRVHASSELAGYSAGAVFRESSLTSWRAATDDAAPWWQMDFGRSLRFGGVIIHWPEPLPARTFDVEISNDGCSWTSVFRTTHCLGMKSHIPTPGAEASFLRIRFANPAEAALQSLQIRPDAYSRTPNEFIHQVAADFPRGWFPRYWLREQSYWTPIGSPDGKRRALINEEGMVEVDEAGFSLEPILVHDGQRITWADVAITGKLPKGGLPVPSVRWQREGLSLEILPWVEGKVDELTLHVTYRLRSRKSGVAARLVIAVRPYQVNPPWQAFRNLGGRSPIHRISTHNYGLKVDLRAIAVSPAATEQGAAAFQEGGILWFLASGIMSAKTSVEDEFGNAEAALAWDLDEGAALLEVTISVPYFKQMKTTKPSARANALARWKQMLTHVVWQVPACATPAIDCFKTAAGHILINRDGPAMQPGPRRYTRSWVRDCVIMGAALAKAGLPHALYEFLTWYAQFQREDGFVPCVVDRDGVDWLVEHDSHGQFLWGIREVLRERADASFLHLMLPHVTKAANYLMVLRRTRITAPYQSGEAHTRFGLLPESASHEGYLAHPVHSYWDDFWGIRGLEAAADIAHQAGLVAAASRWKSEAMDLQRDTLASMNKVIAEHQLAYIPGSVEWADFDPTATANAIAQLDFADVLPERPLHAMLDTYLADFRRRHSGAMPWNNYSAYEIRIIGALVRLGRRDEANELLRFFLSDRRPLEWNQWPEITWRNPRAPGHLGDVPHTWIAAEYLLAVAMMVACEREATDSMVLASGLPWEWIANETGFAVKGLRTRYGALDFRIRAIGNDSIEVEIGVLSNLPSQGLFIAPPLPSGKRIKPGVTMITVASLPFKAVLELA